MLKAVVVVGILAVIVGYGIEFLSKEKFLVHDPSQAAVIVTGASSGLGRHAAVELAEQVGFTVFAAVRKQADIDALNSLKLVNLKPIIMDVSKDDQVTKAKNEIISYLDSNKMKLAGLVNNAGVSGDGNVVEDADLESIKLTFDINVFGSIRVTRAFLSRLRLDHGRILNIGSVAGLISLPGGTSYSGSKYALEAFNDALRRELFEFGVSVSMINPGYVKSLIFEKNVAKVDTMRKGNSYTDVYSEFYAKNRQRTKTRAEKNDLLQGPEDTTTPAIIDALTNEYPHVRYLVSDVGNGITANALYALVTYVPARVIDLALRSM